MGLCEGRNVVVTGAGRGIGREHALSLARQGAPRSEDSMVLGPIVAELLAGARANSGMDGESGHWPQTCC